ncbi:MAG: hypothetical protein JWO36_6307 [Myxococcales bacterium]|nr:hypothetical protein [Myxococcales bacterium]
MKFTLGLLLLGLVACSHNHTDANNPQLASAESEPNEPPVDPTLPSWAPRSCAAYHTAVVEALACEAIPQDSRDAIKGKYEASNAGWQAMHDAPQGTIDQVRASCTEDMKAVRAQSDGKCAQGQQATK